MTKQEIENMIMVDETAATNVTGWTLEDIRFALRALPFLTLADAWDWHIDVGADVSRPEQESPEEIVETTDVILPPSTEEQNDDLAACDVDSQTSDVEELTPIDPQTQATDLGSYTKTHPEWDALLLEMATWAKKQGVYPINQGHVVSKGAPLLPGIKARVADLSFRDDKGRYLQSFLLHMLRRFSWLGRAWQFDDPVSASMNQEFMTTYFPCSFFKKHFGFNSEKMRNLRRRNGLHSRQSGRYHYSRPCDVAELIPDELKFEMLATIDPSQLPKVATLPPWPEDDEAAEAPDIHD